MFIGIWRQKEYAGIWGEEEFLLECIVRLEWHDGWIDKRVEQVRHVRTTKRVEQVRLLIINNNKKRELKEYIRK